MTDEGMAGGRKAVQLLHRAFGFYPLLVRQLRPASIRTLAEPLRLGAVWCSRLLPGAAI